MLEGKRLVQEDRDEGSLTFGDDISAPACHVSWESSLPLVCLCFLAQLAAAGKWALLPVLENREGNLLSGSRCIFDS